MSVVNRNSFVIQAKKGNIPKTPKPEITPTPQKKNNVESATKKTTKSSQRKEKLIHCPTCNLPFKGKESLTTHIRNWHPEKLASA